MNLTELKVARIRRGIRGETIADALGKTVDSYIKRENGNVRVTLSDAIIITDVLKLSLQEFAIIFFDGELPIRIKDNIDYNFRQYIFPLREARKRACYTEEQVAEKLNLPISAYLAREKNKVPVSLIECAVLSKMFGLSLSEFNDIFFRSCLPYRKNDLASFTNIIPQKAGEINAEESYESCL